MTHPPFVLFLSSADLLQYFPNLVCYNLLKNNCSAFGFFANRKVCTPAQASASFPSLHLQLLFAPMFKLDFFQTPQKKLDMLDHWNVIFHFSPNGFNGWEFYISSPYWPKPCTEFASYKKKKICIICKYTWF